MAPRFPKTPFGQFRIELDELDKGDARGFLAKSLCEDAPGPAKHQREERSTKNAPLGAES
jgi:hypothetical protein